MVIVLATTRVKENMREEWISSFKAYAETVRKEQGCIEYFPAVDLKTDLLPQALGPNEVTIVEKWESMQDLQNHLQSAEMKAFGEKTQGMTEGMSAKVLQPA